MKIFFSHLSVVLLLFSSFSFAQNSQWDLQKDNKTKVRVFNTFFETKEHLYADLKKKYPKKIFKLMSEELDDFYKDFEKQFEDDVFVFDSRFYSYVNELFEEIIRQNPEVANAKGILISRKTTLNAYSLPNEFVVINLGLFYWLENQDQMAAIIAHELGHSYFNHSLSDRVNTLLEENSKESKKELKKLSKSKKGKSIKAREALSSSLYAKSKHKREKELQADSMGYHFIKNSSFDKNQIVSSMELSSKYDSLQPVGLNADMYRSLFDLEEQAFKEEWLQVEDLSSYNYDLLKSRFIKDSIASHPDMETRIEKLISLFPELETNTKLTPSGTFTELEKLAKMNRVVSLHEDELYAHSLYECLFRIQSSNEVDYYKYWLGKNLEELHKARLNYTFNKHVNRINPKNQSESYMQFLSFLWNLSTSELGILAAFYQY